MGARVGRSIALSSSQTQGHNITRGSLNQGGHPELGGQQAASLKSVLWFCLLDGTVVELRQGLLALVLGELVGCKFACLHVALIQFRVLLPPLRQVVQRMPYLPFGRGRSSQSTEPSGRAIKPSALVAT